MTSLKHRKPFLWLKDLLALVCTLISIGAISLWLVALGG